MPHAGRIGSDPVGWSGRLHDVVSGRDQPPGDPLQADKKAQVEGDAPQQGIPGKRPPLAPRNHGEPAAGHEKRQQIPVGPEWCPGPPGAGLVVGGSSPGAAGYESPQPLGTSHGPLRQGRSVDHSAHERQPLATVTKKLR